MIDDANACSARRNHFFRRKPMRVEEFKTEQGYFLGRRRLLNRAVLGWGVASGFALSRGEAAQGAAYPPLIVRPGLALDRDGREIELTQATSPGLKNTFVLIEDAGGCRLGPLDKCEEGNYLLSIHYAEVRVGDVQLGGDCGCDEIEKQFVCETAVFSLERLCDEACPCTEKAGSRKCRCGTTDSCCKECGGRHGWLGQGATEATIPAHEGELCTWNGYRIALEDRVGLACVSVVCTGNPCAPIAFKSINDACGPRKILKGNELLYDLIRGEDLTRICKVSWAKWHRERNRMPWDEFVGMFGVDVNKPEQRPNGVTTFSVEFSGPVRADSLQPDVIVMTAIFLEQATGWRQLRRVPITRLVTDPRVEPGAPPMPPGMTNYMVVVVRDAWIREQMQRGEDSWLTERDFTVEIEIRGDWILDCRGVPVDANSRGLTAAPTGDGVPGGLFLSTFRVERKPNDPQQAGE